MIGFLTRPRWSAVDWSLLVLLAMAASDGTNWRWVSDGTVVP